MTTRFLLCLTILAISSSHAFGLPEKKTERVDGRPSSAVISGGASNDGGSSTTEVVIVRSPTQINVSIAPEAAHIGKSAEIVIVVNIGSAMLALDRLGNLSPLDELKIPIFTSIARLGQHYQRHFFSGSFADSDIGEYQIFIGYRLRTGTGVITHVTSIGDIIYNVEPIRLKVQSIPAGLTLSRTKNCRFVLCVPGGGEHIAIPYKCELPSCAKTLNSGLYGPNPLAEHGHYSLAARSGDFTIASVKAIDLNGGTNVSVQGLQAGQVIREGEEVWFSLTSGLTGGRQALLQWTIEAEGLGIIFIDTLSFKSN